MRARTDAVPRLAFNAVTRGVSGSGRMVALGIVLLTWVLVVAINAPGHVTTDSVMQLLEGRTGVYHGGHPPLMSLMLGVFDRILPGTSLYMMVVSGVFFLSVFLPVATAQSVSIWRSFLIIIVILSPLILNYQGVIWKDVLFANLACLAFSLLYVAERNAGLGRLSMIGLAMFVASLSAQARQNGLLVPGAIGGYVALSLLWQRQTGTTARLWAERLGGLMAGALAGLAVHAAISSATLGLIQLTAKTPPQSSTRIGIIVIMRYDIAGIAARASRPLDALSKRGLDTNAIMDDARRYYSPERTDSMNPAIAYSRELGKLDFPELVRAWSGLIVSHPWAYAAHRGAVFRWMVWPPAVMRCLPATVGVEGLPDVLTALGMSAGLRPSDRAMYALMAPLFDTPIFRHAFYALVACGLLVLLFIQPWKGSMVVAACLVTALLFAGSWLAIGLSCDFRYIYFLPLAVTFAIVALLCSAPTLVPAVKRASAGDRPSTGP